jgi:hypothetical protein
MLDKYVIDEISRVFQPYGVFAVAELIAVAQQAYRDGERRCKRQHVPAMLASISLFYGIEYHWLKVMFDDAYLQGKDYNHEWSRTTTLIAQEVDRQDGRPVRYFNLYAGFRPKRGRAA